jgi:hypothetical protein
VRKEHDGQEQGQPRAAAGIVPGTAVQLVGGLGSGTTRQQPAAGWIQHWQVGSREGQAGRSVELHQDPNMKLDSPLACIAARPVTYAQGLSLV